MGFFVCAFSRWSAPERSLCSGNIKKVTHGAEWLRSQPARTWLSEPHLGSVEPWSPCSPCHHLRVQRTHPSHSLSEAMDVFSCRCFLPSSEALSKWMARFLELASGRREEDEDSAREWVQRLEFEDSSLQEGVRCCRLVVRRDLGSGGADGAEDIGCFYVRAGREVSLGTKIELIKCCPC